MFSNGFSNGVTEFIKGNGFLGRFEQVLDLAPAGGEFVVSDDHSAAVPFAIGVFELAFEVPLQTVQIGAQAFAGVAERVKVGTVVILQRLLVFFAAYTLPGENVNDYSERIARNSVAKAGIRDE